MRFASLFGNAFDEVAPNFGELLRFGARRDSFGTIEPLLRLFQTIKRNNCNTARWRSLSGCNLPAKNDVLPSETLKRCRHAFNDVEKRWLIRHLQCFGNPKRWRHFGLRVRRAQTDTAESKDARQCRRQLDLRAHLRPPWACECDAMSTTEKRTLWQLLALNGHRVDRRNACFDPTETSATPGRDTPAAGFCLYQSVHLSLRCCLLSPRGGYEGG